MTGRSWGGYGRRWRSWRASTTPFASECGVPTGKRRSAGARTCSSSLRTAGTSWTCRRGRQAGRSPRPRQSSTRRAWCLRWSTCTPGEWRTATSSSKIFCSTRGGMSRWQTSAWPSSSARRTGDIRCAGRWIIWPPSSSTTWATARRWTSGPWGCWCMRCSAGWPPSTCRRRRRGGATPARSLQPTAVSQRWSSRSPPRSPPTRRISSGVSSRPSRWSGWGPGAAAGRR
mmetsp:Transcript_42529/g.136441  ORF Transcript_42529/g.136441 Transcript_42529/m.136441 type:complete len:229 (-) Transcript_42529:838-1524(-)